MSMDTSSPANQAAESPSFVEFDQIILFGDSITQGAYNQENGFAFAAALQHDYIRRYDVINRGFSGYTSEQALVILPQIFPPADKAKVALMTIFFGANDAVLAGGSQHVPLDTYRDRLKAIITHPTVQSQGPGILLLTPPPVNEYQMGNADVEKHPNFTLRTAANTKRYADTCREVGKALNVPVVDIWAAFMSAAGWKEGEPLVGSLDVPRNAKLEALLSDGLHFNPSGYRIMYEEVMEVIRVAYNDKAPENVPMRFPTWESAPRS